MITQTLSALTNPKKGVLEPVHKLNQQAIAALEKLAAHQIDSLKVYSELGVSQLKAVVKVKDVEGLQNLLSNQTDILKKVSDRLIFDFKEIFQLGADIVSQSKKSDVATVKAA